MLAARRSQLRLPHAVCLAYVLENYLAVSLVDCKLQKMRRRKPALDAPTTFHKSARFTCSLIRVPLVAEPTRHNDTPDGGGRLGMVGSGLVRRTGAVVALAT